MRKLLLSVTAASSVFLVACTPTLPSGPNVAVMPGKNKSFESFQNDNAICMQYARAQLGVDPRDQAEHDSVTGAATGALLGAAAGAALGDSSRAAGVGAGAGLLMGAAVGNNNAVRSTRELQHRYDLAYGQCMYAKGNQLPRDDYPHYRRVIYSEPAYYPPPPPPYYRRGYYPPPPPGY
jgi:uncharacterized protein YcfJ